MSKIVTSKFKLTNPEAIERACQKIVELSGGLVRFERNSSVRYFFGDGPKCDYVLKLQGRYDLGIKKVGEQYEITCDNELLGGRYETDGYGRKDSGRKFLGEEAKLFNVAYQTACTQRIAEAYGYAYVEGVNEEGEPYLDVEVPDYEYA